MPDLVQKEKVGSVSGRGGGRATVFVLLPAAQRCATQQLLLLSTWKSHRLVGGRRYHSDSISAATRQDTWAGVAWVVRKRGRV